VKHLRRNQGGLLVPLAPHLTPKQYPVVLNHSVMAGHSPPKTGVNALMPGHPRLSRCGTDVDARHISTVLQPHAFAC
jgi:hypothetical protein